MIISMKKTILTLALLLGISLSLFAQREIPMFFDRELGLQTGSITRTVVYSPDGGKVAVTFGNNKKIAIWDAASGREMTRLAGHSEPIWGIVFSFNGRQLASFARDSTIKIWDTQNGALIRSITLSGVNAIALSPDGNRIAGVLGPSGGNGIKIWNTANGSEILNLVGHTAAVMSVAYSPDGKQIVTSSVDHTVRIWDAGNGRNIRTINSEKEFLNAVYSPNGQQIAAYADDFGDDFGIWIFNAASGQELMSIPVQLLPQDLAYSPDGKQLLVNVWIDNGNTHIIKVFDPDTGRELRSFNNGNSTVSYSPDGRKILTDSAGFNLKIGDTTYGASYAGILDAATGRTIGTIGYGPLNVGAKAFADLQIARFLGDTAAVGRHEAVLKFITDKGYATRQEIEAFYRDNVRAQIAGVVVAEFKGITVPASTVAYFKEYLEKALTTFFLTPTQANFNIIKEQRRTYIGLCEKAVDLEIRYKFSIQRSVIMEVLEGKSAAEVELRNARNIQNDLNEIRRVLKVPNDAEIEWDRLKWAIRGVFSNLNTELAQKM
jgi:DNA-binding beta-propeller fold protein YncE